MSLGVGAAVLIVPTFLPALNGDGFGWLLLADGTVLVVWKEAIRKHLDDLQAQWQALG